TTVGATHNLAHAAVAAGTKAATTSSASATVTLGTAGASNSVTFATAAWTSVSTGTKVTVIGLALAGGSYPITNHLSSHRSTPPFDHEDRPRAASFGDEPISNPLPNGHSVQTQSVLPEPTVRSAREATPEPVRQRVEPATTNSSKLPHRGATDAATRNAKSEPVLTPISRAVTQPNHLQLREETLLIERALIAVRNDDKAAAARWLGEHERRFPIGVLAKERERLQATLY